MSDVQLRNGFTRIDNELLEALAKTALNGTQRRILDVVFRQTYGYQRKSHDLSVTFVANATNIHKKQIQRELIALIEKSIITVVSEATFNKSRVIRFNEDYNEWVNSSEVAKKFPPNKIDTHTGNELAPSTGNELVPQIKKKENIKENIYSTIIDYLNIKCNTNYRATTDKTKKLINARMNEGFLLDDFKKVIDIKTAEWTGLEMSKYLRPQTLFGTNFESYLNQKPNLKKGSDTVGKFGNAIKFDIPKINKRTADAEKNFDNEIEKLGLI